MNVQNTSWEISANQTADRVYGEGRTEEDHNRREQLVKEVAAVGIRNGWSRKDAYDRIGMAAATFSQWWSGNYSGRIDKQNEKVEAWLEVATSMQEMIREVPPSPEYITTRASTELRDGFMSAQMLSVMVVMTLPAGMGKTFVSQIYTQGNANCWLVTLSAATVSKNAVLQAVAKGVGLDTNKVGLGLQEAIGEKIQKRNAPSLLIIDEAQNASNDAINQLRHFSDTYKCGLAIVGNNEVYGRYQHEWVDNLRFAQLASRIFKRVNIAKPETSDLVAFINAHGIKDADQVKFLTGVGLKAGALRQIDLTVKLAKMAAAGSGKALELEHLKWAWSNRGLET